MEGVKG
jgi:alpha-D-ribose 1-methylphosphonate 5-triphosphate diphosphatase PhnM